MMSSDYSIESNIPFTVKVKNQAGRVLLPIWVMLFVVWGFLQIKFITTFISFFMALLNAKTREGVTIIYNPPYLEQILGTMVWAISGTIFIVGIVLGFLFGVFALQEILWRLFGTETLEISKEQITWSRHIPFVRLAKSYPVATLLKIKVLRPDSIDIEKLDKIRPVLVVFRGMGNGAISLEYEKSSVGALGLIKSVDAEIILNRLKDLSYLDLPIEV
ncbi:MAG: hypothetical protein WBW94_11280 [Anaerolineales bacterium]